MPRSPKPLSTFLPGQPNRPYLADPKPEENEKSSISPEARKLAIDFFAYMLASNGVRPELARILAADQFEKFRRKTTR